jgi:hypothetical protein
MLVLVLLVLMLGFCQVLVHLCSGLGGLTARWMWNGKSNHHTPSVLCDVISVVVAGFMVTQCNGWGTPSVFGRKLQGPPVRGVNARDECQWPSVFGRKLQGPPVRGVNA